MLRSAFNRYCTALWEGKNKLSVKFVTARFRLNRNSFVGVRSIRDRYLFLAVTIFEGHSFAPSFLPLNIEPFMRFLVPLNVVLQRCKIRCEHFAYRVTVRNLDPLFCVLPPFFFSTIIHHRVTDLYSKILAYFSYLGEETRMRKERKMLTTKNVNAGGEEIFYISRIFSL